MLVYTFDRTLDGVLSAVFDAYFRHQQPEVLAAEGEQLPLFCDEVWRVVTTEEKAQRVWAGLEKRLSREAVRLIGVSWLSEERELNTPLFHYIYKVFTPPLTPPLRGEGSACGASIERNFSDPDVLYVTQTARRVMHEQLRMKQFIRFQKAKDGTYLAVVSPDHNVLPLITDHFQDRFNDQPWLIYDARRHYGYYYAPQQSSAPGGKGSAGGVTRVTFEDESRVPFSLEDGKLRDDVLSDNDRLLQDLWRTYFKAICIKERMNPRKQLNDMPRRYWKYMTEKQL
ncbi:MAG: TIGR03915 family putative DNA repair protein [Prevotella sp.]|nr:TIGR03915 family putative DNA repair protein [Prevotella sp.]